MTKVNKFFSLIFAVVFVLIPIFSVGCGNNTKSLNLTDCAIMHEQEFGGVYIKNSIEEFNALGFEYGDSVNITFSNGYKLLDIPYYNGYYTKTGEPLLIAYPGYEYIKAAINNGDDLWDYVGVNGTLFAQEKKLLWNAGQLNEDMTATITISEKGKYKQIQQARDISYFDDRSLYPSDEVFANFRSLKGGSLKEELLFRSASPCDNQHNRALYVDKLIEDAQINFIINLADNDEKIQGYMQQEGFDLRSKYFLTLYDANNTDNDKVEPIALNMNYNSTYFKGQVVKAMMTIIENDGPFLIHCTEGKDRTGFVCMFLEAFASASYTEIVEDYMITYFNYYAITKAFDENRYTTIVENVLNPMIEVLCEGQDVDIKTTNLSEYAKQFLLNNGMTNEQVEALKNKICKIN